jgi:hypothetical protein
MWSWKFESLAEFGEFRLRQTGVLEMSCERDPVARITVHEEYFFGPRGDGGYEPEKVIAVGVS